MPPIQLRRGSSIPNGEAMFIGEPMWDPTNSRLGVFNNRAPTAMEWYPSVVGNKLILNPSQTLGGKITAGAENNVYLDWSVQDQVTVRNRDSGFIYATFAAGGASFNAVTGVGTPYLGLTNLLPNGNLAVRRASIPITTVSTSTVAGRSSLLAPNWQLWKTAGTAGVLTASYLNLAAGVPFAGCPGVFAVNASGGPNSAGVRTFLFGYEAVAGREVTFSSYLLGANGAKTRQRGITDDGTTLFNEEVTATGVWQRTDYTFTPAVSAGPKWIGIDVLYNPSGDTAQSQNWQIAAAQLQYGSSASIFENRPYALEKALCNGVYIEGKVRLSGASDLHTVDIDNFGIGTKVEAVEAAAKPVTISDMDAFGFNLQVPSLTAASTVKYAAYQMPTTAETA